MSPFEVGQKRVSIESFVQVGLGSAWQNGLGLASTVSR